MSVDRPRVVEYFQQADLPPAIEPRYNIAPTQDILTVQSREGTLEGRMLRWGISLPSERDGPDRMLINVRSETALRGGFYRRLLDGHRVLIPASHFYEWRRDGRRKLPFLIGHRDGLMAFAGLAGRWVSPDTGVVVPAVVILTCPANEAVSSFHDRMPVVLDPGSWDRWLDVEAGAQDVAGLLTPCPPASLVVRPVSPLVNDHRNDGPSLLEPPEAGPEQTTLPLQTPG